METKSQETIRKIKSAKSKGKVTYSQIMEELTGENGVPVVSYTTLRRVCRSGSEARANSFSYEDTLVPILQAIRRIVGDPDQLAETVRRQQEQIEQISAVREKLAADVVSLTEQLAESDALIRRLIHRLDQKDEVIHQFILDLKEKDETINRLLERKNATYDMPQVQQGSP